ncbi:phospholipase D family protein [Amantichitinum ursilacus]|uniref:Putative cardiolipin synthase YbhO n=1 Tax=Amantichitinum ursilacus TaxID=857265 RepID=A0A0N0GNK8_9NEIS|nr:phospholipase D family protein [Amantichitinum ursilacus]KPC52865.1 putative cardiolipin synthase YbhO [Amantichitinum ursilacus]
MAAIRLMPLPAKSSAVILLAGVLLTACATRADITQYPRPPSTYLPTPAASALAQSVASQVSAHPGQSGFYLLVSGKEAFEARMALIQQAQKSLDLQYYAAMEDRTGHAIMDALVAAARRGVRVRLLLDDMNIKNPDNVVALAATEPNFEARVFNPVTTGGRSALARASAMFSDFDHLERRMHNKSLIADNAFAILGGRNLADQYFGVNSDVNFRDLDILIAGALPDHASRSFDHYWNSKESYPVAAVANRPPSPEVLKAWKANPQAAYAAEDPKGGKEAEKGALPIPDAASSNALLARASQQLIWANAWLAVDNPNKVDPDEPDTPSKPGKGLATMLDRAHKEFIIISAYFVPQDGGTAKLNEMSQHGVKVKVLTNSLASTDVAAVHAGYRHYRKALLASGVDIYEFKPVGGEPSGAGFSKGSSRASLHTKAYVVDRKYLMIGSFNLDPRSVNLNTEQAVLINSPQLAGQVAALYDKATLPQYSYHVTLKPDADGKTSAKSALVWTATDDKGQPKTWGSDPDAGFSRRFISRFVSWLPADGEL